MADFSKVVTFLQDELSSIRTGRANPDLLADIEVDAYGSQQPIKAVAQLSTPEATTILVSPWDKSMLEPIEKAIAAANLEGQASNDGSAVRFNLPALTEERRKELTKVVGEKLEAARVSLRNLRRDEIAAAEKEKLPEDALERRKKEVDDAAGKAQHELESIAAKKQQELMTV